ncbi:MAG: restriction endonuclease, partial [Cyanobacteriota bacterium]|nr:restriction endonuclease [Cyanobacteriota bacterium]
NQLTALAEYQVFDVPIRLIGLFEAKNTTIPVTWTVYSSTRYSRKVQTRETRQCQIISGKSSRNRCKINLL